MTRTLPILLLLFGFAIQAAADHPVSANTTRNSDFEALERSDLELVNAIAHSWSMDRCFLGAVFADPRIKVPSANQRFGGVTCPFESCFFVDDEIAPRANVATSEPAKIEFWDLGNRIGSSGVIEAFRPNSTHFFELVYESLTWTGEFAPAPVKITPLQTVAAESIVEQESLAEGAVGEQVMCYDVESAIKESWNVIAFGGSQPVHKPIKSEMDDYWWYYSDCDRWGIVFNEAAAVDGVENGPSTNPWVTLQGIVKVVVENADEVAVTVGEFKAVAEFYAVESARPNRFNTPFLMNGMTDWIKRTEISPKLIEELIFKAQQIVEENRDSWFVRVLDHVVADFQKTQLEEEQRLARVYLAPRISWLSQRLDQIAKRLETSVDVAKDKTSTTLK